MSIERISPEILRRWLEGANPPAVIDVRDEDYVGGHVLGSIHVPSTTFINKIPHLREKVRDTDRLVFYCQYSQQRGPSCAMHYHMGQNPPSLPSSRQQVYVLDGGFSNWAQTFMGKEGYTEGLIPDLYV